MSARAWNLPTRAHPPVTMTYMPDDRCDNRLRQLAQALSRSLSDVDLDEVADRLGVDPDRVRGAAGVVEGWLSDRAAGESPLFGDEPSPAPAGSQPNRPMRAGGLGPHPLDLPSDEQGRALSALGSGRWTVRAGSSRLSSTGTGPEPPEIAGQPSDLVNELRSRDWITADGTVTLVGRQALLRWSQTAEMPLPDPPAVASDDHDG
jgi:hypothetical protein